MKSQVDSGLGGPTHYSVLSLGVVAILTRSGPSHQHPAATPTPAGNRPARQSQQATCEAWPVWDGRQTKRPLAPSKQQVFYQRVHSPIGSTREETLSREAFQGA